MPTGVVDDWTSVVHLVGKHGEAWLTPAIWFKPSTTMMVISNGANNNVTDTTTNILPLHEWTHVDITQYQLSRDGEYRFIITLNYLEIITWVENFEARDFSDVTLYASDDFEIAAKARINNLSIETNPDDCE